MTEAEGAVSTAPFSFMEASAVNRYLLAFYNLLAVAHSFNHLGNLELTIRRIAQEMRIRLCRFA